MPQRLEMVEFGVAGLQEVRTLLKRWKAVLGELSRGGSAGHGHADPSPGDSGGGGLATGGRGVLGSPGAHSRFWSASWPTSRKRAWR